MQPVIFFLESEFMYRSVCYLRISIYLKVSSAVMKHYDKTAKLWRKGFIQLTLLYHSPSLKEVRTGTQAGQEPLGKSCGRGPGGELLTALLHMACSAWYIIEPRATSPGTAAPIMGWALPCQSLVKKMPTGFSRLAYSPIL